MDEITARIDRFFKLYECNCNSEDAFAVESQFAETFLVAGPTGAQILRRDDFMQALPRRKALFDRAGCKGARLVSKEILAATSRYRIVRTEWAMDFVPDSHEAQRLTVSSLFVIDAGSEECTILMYLNGQDILEMMRERHLLPGVST